MISTDAKVYEVLALAMRYFFMFLGVMIVWRAFSWLRKDRSLKHRRLKQLPDAGTIGIFTIQRGSRQFKEGEVIPVPHEGTLGYLRTCDVVVPVEDVATMHLDFTFVDGEGLYIYPLRGCDAVVDGYPLTSRQESRLHPMLHGSILEVGQAVLQLGVFAGLNVQEASFGPVYQDQEYPADDPAPPELPAEAYPPAYYQPWQPQPPTQPPYAPPFQPVNNPWRGGDDDAP